MGLGIGELLIILAIVVLLFGATRLPKLARSLGETQRELRAAQKEINGDTSSEPVEERKPQT